jgi:hypothetical protein
MARLLRHDNADTVQKRDIATATATFGFTRNLGSAISVVVGSVSLLLHSAKKLRLALVEALLVPT